MDVIYFVKALLKKKWWIIISTIVAIVLSFVFTMDRAKLYVSNAQMSTGFTINDDIKLRDENNVNLFEADVKFNNVVETITSPTVISLLSYQLLIHDLTSPKPFRFLTEKDRRTPEYLQFNRVAGLQLARHKLDSLQMLTSYQPEERKLLEYMKLCKYDYESLRKRLNIGRLQRTDYIDMSFGSENPELSAFVVNTLYSEFTRYYRSMRSERSVENVGTFEALVNQKKTELDQKIDALRNYKSSEGLLNVEAASGNELGLISQLEKALLDEKATYNNLNSSVQSVNEQLAQMNQGKAVYDNNNAEIVALRKQLNQSNDEYQRGGSSDADLADKIKTQRAQLQRLMSSSAVATGKTVSKDELLQKKASLDADLKASLLNIASLQNKIGSLRGSVGSYANKEATVSTLQKEVDLAQEEYNKLKEKLNTALDSRLAPPDDFRQTLKGQPAFKPESSKRIIIMGMAGASVFLLTTLGVLFMEFFDNSIKSPSVFERHVDLKLISTINHADLHRYSIPEVLQKQISDDDASRRRQNTFRELLRKLRYEVESSNKSIFLFTSTESQQGKTTLVQALAYSLSLSNKRVLIIDTNFCNNDLTVALQAKPTLETFSMAPEEVSIEKVREIVTTYSVEGIEVIGCKGGDYTPSEILPRNHLLNYLPQLKGYYDFVLLEGAPLNDYTDSKELVHYVEGVIAIFSSRASLKQNDKESIQFLQSMNGKLLGAVLNNVNDDFLEL
ncbi:Uncharacterized protein involved in exopolysaccharide biosynthesis [Chitinophaga rupis]|uniref:Uncharacterized protein involved in exopolysaccharide biosynthesis n=1 Tax=Chitinophaga rupis TaxID=573321 RepID=A0A1H8K5Y9_9BACT|nr:hypothetical protein [Chitinophaga rupis]SEN88430.1 Uncharacterized protein involved in exopolysaccharide biosynthesis [Chitinophaga rupis]